MLELEGGRIGQPREKLSPLNLITLLVTSIDVKTLFWIPLVLLRTVVAVSQGKSFYFMRYSVFGAMPL